MESEPVRQGALFCVLIDPEHDIAGFVLDWIRALAARLERLEVIALEVRDLAGANLPPNVRVHSLGKEKGYFRPRLFLNSQRALVKALDRADFLLCHMMPVYALVSAPLCRLKKKPLILWYTHQNLDLKLRLAVRAADRVVTAAPEAMRVKTPKKRVIGHGIDTQRFKPGPLREENDGALRVVSVGRLSPVKRLEFLVEAASYLRDQGELDRFRFTLVGQPSDRAQAEYVQGIRARIERDWAWSRAYSILWARFPLPGWSAVTRRPICSSPCRSSGGLDKAVLEAMACGLPVPSRPTAPLIRSWGSWLSG